MYSLRAISRRMDTALLDPTLVLGFVTEEGGPTSHSAILARALGVPAVVALPGAGELAEGTVVAVDGSTGEIFVDPSAEKRAEMEAAAAARKAALSSSTGPGATSDGHKVPLLANVGGPGDVPAAVEAGAEGVGLFRTEFLFLDDSKQAPSEEKQVAAYRAVLEAFPEGRVVVRVLDAGADKPLDFLTAGRRTEPGARCPGAAQPAGPPRRAAYPADRAGEGRRGSAGVPGGHGAHGGRPHRRQGVRGRVP